MPPEPTALENEIEEILQKIKAYLPDFKEKKFLEALDFAKHAHKGQLRRSGEPYITHPLSTVKILTHLHVDEDTLIAALLHDVPEDTEITLSEISKKFGGNISYLVDGITKLSKVYYRQNMQDRQIESLKKLLIHSAEDLRVILIKLADRLHNMRTLRFIADEKKRARISHETLEIYVPIANLLGIGEIRHELEDLCFRNLYPNEYEKLKKEVEENMEERNFILEETVHLMKKELKKNDINSEIVGRPKTFYSIFQKLQTKKNLYNIDDIIAIRVIVPTRKDCYTVFGIIHHLFKPKMEKMKDYIAVPKPNGYQGLHTTVFGLNGSVVEFQIRTRYMHLEAEYGIAAHYFYKYSNERELADLMNQRSSWVQRILDIQKEQPNNESFLQNLKLDIFQDRIFTFTPKGDVIDLPQGASAIDFAYAIHTEVGNHAFEAEINGTKLPLTTTLMTGNTIKIITSEKHKPKREWLSYVKTNLAHEKIRAELRKMPREEKIRKGRKYLQKEFNYIGRNFLEELTTKKIQMLSEKLPCKTLNGLLAGVGEGIISPRQILTAIYKEDEFKPKEHFLFRSQTIKRAKPTKVSLKIFGDQNKVSTRTILSTLNSMQIPLINFKTWKKCLFKNENVCTMDLFVQNYDELSQLFESLEQLNGVHKVIRMFTRRKIFFVFASITAALLWMAHPFLIQHLILTGKTGFISNSIRYCGLFLIFGLVFYVKYLTKRSFPEFEETKFFWPAMFVLITLALATIILEIILLGLNFNWVLTFGIISLIYLVLASEYITYRYVRSE